MKKKFVILFLTLSMLLCSLTVCYADNADKTAETSSKKTTANAASIYPSEDSDSIYYSYATNVPDIIYSTTASENELSGRPYYVEGTVTKVYDSMAEMSEAYGMDTSDLDESLFNIRTFILKTDKGEVAFWDLATCVIQTLDDQFSDDPDTLNDYLASHCNGLTSQGYTDFPSEGESVTVYGFYVESSKDIQMPVFFYGLTELLHSSFVNEATIYPGIDSYSPYYSYMTSLPDIIYSTSASENNLSDRPYYVEGTVTKVYDSMAEMLEEYGMDTSDYDDSIFNIRTFIVKTEKGEVVFLDLTTCCLQSVADEFSDDPDSLTALDIYLFLNYNGLTSEGYTDFPSEGELVTVYGFYEDFSYDLQMPMFCYGLADFLLDSYTSDTET